MTDYYHYGMDMPGRSYTAEAYRYGYQGSEKDNGLAGGTGYTTFFRGLDPRIGRWLTPDPKVFPWQSPYCSMDCNPVALVDPLGAETGDGGTLDEVTVTAKNLGPQPQSKGLEPSTVDASTLKPMPNQKVANVSPKNFSDSQILDFAYIANDVYDPKHKSLGSGWEIDTKLMDELSKKYKDITWSNSKTGFQSAIYRKGNQYVYATAGTDDMHDVLSDIYQFLGKNEPQYPVSMRNAEIISQVLKNKSVVFVGHSLGGGLASANALKTERAAVTFNAAGLHKKTKSNLTGDPNDITAVIVVGEILDTAQSLIKDDGIAGRAEGNKIMIAPSKVAGAGSDKMYPSLIDQILEFFCAPSRKAAEEMQDAKNHSINEVIDSLEKFGTGRY